MYFLYALYSCIIITCFTLFGYQSFANGKEMDHSTIGYVYLTSFIMINLLVILLSLYKISLVSVAMLIGSFVLFMSVTVIYSVLSFDFFAMLPTYFGFIHLLSDSVFYMIVLLVTVTVILPLFIMRSIQQTCWKSLAEHVSQVEKQKQMEYTASKSGYVLDLVLGKEQELPDSVYSTLRRRIREEQSRHLVISSRYSHAQSHEAKRLLSPSLREFEIHEDSEDSLHSH